MAIALAALGAVLLGASDLFAARAGRTTASLSVTRTAVIVSAVVSPLLLVAVPVVWSGRDLLIGAASGVAMIGGLALLYFGYSTSRIGLVAPLSAVLTAAVPVAVGLVGGEQLSMMIVVGMVLGLVALVLTSVQTADIGWQGRAISVGLGSGLLFGVAFTLMGYVGADSGLSAVVVQRLAGGLLLVALWSVRSDPFLVPAGPGRRSAVITGLLAAGAVGSLQLAFQMGELGPVAVAGSQFVTVAVVLAVLIDREPLRWWQGIGVGCTAVGVALIAAG